MGLLRYTDLAFRVAGGLLAPPLFGIIAGMYIDGAVKTSPFFTILLVFLGLAAGLRSLFRLVSELRDIK